MATVFVKDALLQERLADRVRCGVCERRCRIVPGGRGWCQIRENRNGTLVTLAYGLVSSLAANPIEKKPFYHFHPGTCAYTVGSWSCNFGCPWCQNWDISKRAPVKEGRYVSPEEFVELTLKAGCQGTSISFNEPTLSLEWSLDVFRAARERRLYNTFVTNGYMTAQSLSLLIEAGLDAMNVDMKGDAEAVRSYCKGINVERVWANCGDALSRGIHVEMTTLIIPTVNDSLSSLRGIAQRIVRDLSPDIPWHVTAYYPAYRFHGPPTTLASLEQAWTIGRNAGLRFVYVGNVPGHRHDNTHCPGCGTLLIRRRGFDVTANLVSHGRCPYCSQPVAGVWDS